MIESANFDIKYMIDSYVIKARIKGNVKQCHIMVAGYKNKRGKILYNELNSKQQISIRIEKDFDEIGVMIWDDIISVEPIYTMRYLIERK